MRVVPITDEMMAEIFPNGERKVYSAPGGDLLDPVIAPADIVRYESHPEGADEDTVWPVHAAVILIEQEEREWLQETLASDEPVYCVIGWPGSSVPVFMVPWFFWLGAEDLPEGPQEAPDQSEADGGMLGAEDDRNGQDEAPEA